MAKHIEKGKLGECLAETFLKNQSYDILTRNWRFKRFEIDIIAQCENILVFVEVKTRSQLHYGNPESFVDKRKQKLLIDAAQTYIEENNYQGEIRFDIISVYTPEKTAPKIEHFKDAFWDYGDD